MKRICSIIAIALFLVTPNLFSQVYDSLVYELLNQAMKIHVDKVKKDYQNTDILVYPYMDNKVQSAKRITSVSRIMYAMINSKLVDEKEAYAITTSEVADTVNYKSLMSQFKQQNPTDWDCTRFNEISCIDKDSLLKVLEAMPASIAVKSDSGVNKVYIPSPTFVNVCFMLSYPLLFEYKEEQYAILPISVYLKNHLDNKIDMELFKRDECGWKYIYSEMANYRTPWEE